jgi:DtxR family Mn-dependent transcriptional regulator
MNAAQIFRAIWRQRAPWARPAGAPDECPDGVPVHQDGRCEDCDAILLARLAPGEEATVACLEADGRAVARLAALGVLPGARILLVQRYPVYVFRIGYAEVAIDEALASLVRVRQD